MDKNSANPPVIAAVKARGGVTGHNVRYVLVISVVLAVAAMVFAYATMFGETGANANNVVIVPRGQ